VSDYVNDYDDDYDLTIGEQTQLTGFIFLASSLPAFLRTLFSWLIQ